MINNLWDKINSKFLVMMRPVLANVKAEGSAASELLHWLDSQLVSTFHGILKNREASQHCILAVHDSLQLD